MELQRIKGKFEAYQEASCEFDTYVIRPIFNNTKAGRVVCELLKAQAQHLWKMVADLKRDICELEAIDDE